MNTYYENFLQSIQLNDNKQIFLLKGQGYINCQEEAVPKSNQIQKTEKTENLIKLYKEAAKNRYSNLQSFTRFQQPAQNQSLQKKQIQDYRNLIYRNNLNKDKKLAKCITEKEKISIKIISQLKLNPIKQPEEIQQSSERCESRVHYYKAKNKVFIIGDKKRPFTTRIENGQRLPYSKQYLQLFSMHKNKLQDQTKTIDFQSILMDQGIIL